MSNLFMISDLHFGHKNIMKFAGDYRHGDCPESNIQSIIDMWNHKVNKKDKVYVLGDTAFTQDGFDALDELAGRKVLIRGNHDNYFKTEDWLKHFESVESLVKYKGFWLSHAPIHPCELRGKQNIHGHVHQNSVMKSGIDTQADVRYINVCVENVGGAPIEFNRIQEGERGWLHKWTSEEKLELLCVQRKPLLG